MKPDNKTIVIGIGNEYRCDDAAGFLVVRKLKEKNIPSVKVIEHNGDGVSLMDIWQDYSRIIIVDAMQSNNKPGSIQKINVKTKLPKSLSPNSSHLFSIMEAIETAKVFKKLPDDLQIFAIEGKNFQHGTDISHEVNESIDKAVELIISEL